MKYRFCPFVPARFSMPVVSHGGIEKSLCLKNRLGYKGQLPVYRAGYSTSACKKTVGRFDPTIDDTKRGRRSIS
jgi:hypothetical protein